MSKKRKKPLAAREQADAPAPVPHYDAARITKTPRTYTDVTITHQDGREERVLVPVPKGRTSEKKVGQTALHYAHTQQRVIDAWQIDLDDEWLEKLRESLISTAAGYAAIQLVTIAGDRFGEEGLTALYGDLEAALEEDKVDALTEAAIDRATERQKRALRAAFANHEENLNGVIRQIEYNAVTAVLLDFEEAHGDAIHTMNAEEYDQLFNAALDAHFTDLRHEYSMLASQDLARQMLEALEAGSVPLEKLLEYLDVTQSASEAPAPTLELDLARAGLSLLTMQPMQTIDRATRSPSGWLLGADRLPRFNDPRSPLFVEYQRDGATAEALAEGVNRLNPRTADVWRLITARSLEAWPLGQDRPPSVWLDVRELADAMGYKKHHKGGHKPEHIAEVARAVHDLDALYINLPLGTQVYQAAKAGSKRRTPTKLEALRRLKVLLIRGNDEVRSLFGDSWPLRYKLEPGDWIELYPRSYAPLFKALVELPAKAGASTWAKAIGTELLFQYRQNTKNSNGVERLKVLTLLERAGRLEEATESRNKSRMRTYFEEALDLLKAEEVCAGWEYEPEDSDRLEARAGARGWFDVWLECRVLITTPDSITNELQATSGAARKAQRAQRKRRLSDTR